MPYVLPDEATLAAYLAMLRAVLVQARSMTYATNRRVADLLDAVENVPDLLCRWPDADEAIILGDLERWEDLHLDAERRFSRILREGPPAGWQLRWRP